MEYATQWPGTSGTETEKILDLQFRSARETYTDTVRWLYQSGHLDARHVGRLAAPDRGTIPAVVGAR